MKLTFLGTGTSTGVPILGCDCEVCLSKDSRDKRLRCSSLLQIEGKNILIDCGPDFRQQALRSNLNTIDALLFTHPHSDHVGGIDDLRTIPYASFHWKIPEGVDLPRIPFYGLSFTNAAIKKMFYYCFPDSGNEEYKGMLPLLEPHEINSDGTPFEICGGISVTPVFATHGNLTTTGFRIGKLAYLTDFKTIEKKELDKLYDLDVLVLGMLRHNRLHASHLRLDEAMEIVNAVKPKQTYFVHMSHDIGLHENSQDLMPDNCHLAYDGLELEI